MSKTTDNYNKYELGEAIDRFVMAMAPYADSMTGEMKQKIANLGTGMFEGLRETKREYSSDVIPWLKEHTEGFTPEMMAAWEEFSLANDIAYCKGVKKADRFAMDDRDMKEIVRCFKAAEEGRFEKPYWCSDYIDDIDKMKAFVFAFLTDINYHSERKILEEHGVDEFAKVADLWLGAVEDVMEAEAKILGENA